MVKQDRNHVVILQQGGRTIRIAPNVSLVQDQQALYAILLIRQIEKSFSPLGTLLGTYQQLPSIPR